MKDLFPQWLGELEKRHLSSLTFPEVRRAVQALSSLYVERRNRIGQGSALDGAGKRAAFAFYFSPLHFLLVREIVRSLNAATASVRQILDLGCGTGVAGAAWALEMNPTPRIIGVDRNAWAIAEAKWNCARLHLNATFRIKDVESVRIPSGSGVVAAFALNELSESARQKTMTKILEANQHGSPVLIVEPIARRIASWWPQWKDAFTAKGGREDEWRLPVDLPSPLALMDKATRLNHRELTGRSLWLP